MKWNWQQPDWPRFSWSAGRLAQAEQHFLVHGGIIHGAVGHLDREGRDLLIVEAMSDEAVTSSEISSTSDSLQCCCACCEKVRGDSPAA